ncbi:MAG: hypothetical protein F4Y97_08875 [Dehalococcoidia bacterium]|nr:hypothetical protein [Dehalococcoidia bacterium]
MIGSGDWGILQGLPLVSPTEEVNLFFSRQQGEVFLTAAQSAFAIAVFVNLRMSRPEAWALFILFAAQLPLTEDVLGDGAQIVRFWYSIGYMVLCAALLIRNRAGIPGLVRDARDMITGKADFVEEQRH